jgi:hypothetical protein
MSKLDEYIFFLFKKMRKTAANTLQPTSSGLHASVSSSALKASAGGIKPNYHRKGSIGTSQREFSELVDASCVRKKKSRSVRLGSSDKVVQAVEGLTRARQYLERERNLLSVQTFFPQDNRNIIHEENYSEGESDETFEGQEPRPPSTILPAHVTPAFQGAKPHFHSLVGQSVQMGLNEAIAAMRKCLEEAQEQWDGRFIALEDTVSRLQDRGVLADDQARRRDWVSCCQTSIDLSR